MRYPKYKLALLAFYCSLVTLAQPKVSFTFDDGATHDQPGYSFKIWNDMILNSLDKHTVKSTFFVTGHNKTDEKGIYLLKSWNKRGHRIANHTFSHVNYNSNEIDFISFTQEFIKTDSIIRQYSNYTKIFRFPFLSEGNTKEKIQSFRSFLKKSNYTNGHVTIDTFDWYIDSRLKKRLQENSNADITGFKKFYINSILERARLYEDLSYQLYGRHIHHTLLLHHNLTSALFLDDLINAFKDQGWDIVSSDIAYADPIFNKFPTHPGGNFIWALAKDTGNFKAIIKKIEKGSLPQKEEMDKMGL